ncbi:MAG: gliding motility lipoprotein GldD [Bacteroidales bacterium]|nr:gliding motility lipoprotein GldD [Bacteroidales bacterium]MCF8327818.1 gliding motility lipoprotein GldD [Bacteroidales bacterium]
MNKTLIYFLFAIVVIAFTTGGCENDDYYPKPRGYFRIATPEKSYVKLDSNLNYSFEYPGYARITNDYITEGKHNWINIFYPDFKGTLHLSYKPVQDNLPKLIRDAHEFVDKHIPKANAIERRTFINDSASVYGLVYEIKGTGAATPFQFYLTDSSRHFVRGALYFNTKPNNDSLAPVIDFIEGDINQMIETFHWNDKKNNKNLNLN